MIERMWQIYKRKILFSLFSLAIIVSVGVYFIFFAIKPIPKPVEIVTPSQVVEIKPEVVQGDYTLIYKASIPTYIMEHYLKDGRIYYIKQDGRHGSVPHIDVRLEQGHIPYNDLYNYGFIDYVEEVGGKDEQQSKN